LLLGSGSVFALRDLSSLQGRIGGDITRGANELEAGRALLKKANSDHSAALLDQSLPYFKAARTHFGEARTAIEQDGYLNAAGAVPVLNGWTGDRQRSIVGLADMGVALADAGDAGVAAGRSLIQPDTTQKGGQAMIAVLNKALPQIDLVKSDLSRAQAGAAKVDAAVLPASQRPTFLNTKASITTQLASLAEFDRFAPVPLELLGANGPRSYLVAQIDPANLRGSGGFVGSYSVLSTNNGALNLAAGGDILKLDAPYPQPGQKGYVAPPNGLKQFATHGWRLGDSLVSPDFASAGKTALDLYQAEAGHAVDGVIGVDPWAVADLLNVLGPVAIPEYGKTVTAADFPETVFQAEEFRGLTGNANLYDGKKFIGVATGHVLEKLLALAPSSWAGLVTNLNKAVTERHLQVYFTQDALQTEMSRVGWTGSMAPSADEEFIREIESNYGDTKANHFLERKYSLTVQSIGGKLTHHLVIDLKDSMPDGYAGGRQYRCELRFYYPANATDVRMAGTSGPGLPVDEVPPAGLKVLTGWFQINVDLKSGFGTQQVVIDWTTPATAGAHRIYWEKQAGTLADALSVSWASGGQVRTATTDLQSDRLLTFDNGKLTVAAGKTGQAQLPTVG